MPLPAAPGGSGIHAASALVLALILSTGGCDRPPDDLAGEGISEELARHRERTISDLRYAYHLALPESRAEPIEGSAVLRFHWSDSAARPLVIDFRNPEERVRRVRVNGAGAELEASHGHVVVSPSLLLPERENVVEIEFTAGDGPLNRNDGFLYTLFVPDRAHHAVPLFDQPSLKGRFTLSLEIPSGWTAVANGEEALDAEQTASLLASDRPRRTVRFVETEPIPTYLFAFAAGEFRAASAVRDGREMTMHYRETDDEKVRRNLDAVFDLHAAALEWLEAYTGIPYPFGKFDFVAVPSFQYGGMEHPGAILYRESSLLLDESPTQAQVLGRASLIAHETAHMWFGDLVTMRWFDDVWTKEVFANFMAAKIVHPSFPELNHDLRFLLSHHPGAYAIDRTAGANPIRQPLENLNEAGSLYGPVIYQKAPVVMRQLELLVGEETFREGMREYLRTFAFGNATWPELIEILDRRVPEDLAEWSGVWVEEPGRPDVSAEVELDAEGRVARVVVRQEDPEGRGRVWPQRLTLLVGRGPALEAWPVALLDDSVVVERLAGTAAPDFVLPDAGGVGYAHFRLDGGSLEWLLAHLPRLADPVARGVGYLALHDAVLEGEVEPERMLDLLLRAADEEEEEQNIERVLAQLGTVYWRLLEPGARAAHAPHVEAVLRENLFAAASPTLAATWFRGYRRLASTAPALARLERIWSGEEEVPGLTLSESDAIDLALGLAVAEVPGWEQILVRQAARIENPERAARFAFLRPSVDADPAVREAFFDSLRDPAARRREPWVLDGLGYLNHPTRAAHAERFVRPALEMVEEIQRTGDIFFPARWLDAVLGGHASPGAAATVRDFLAERPEYPARLRGKILQSADELERAAAIREGEAPPGRVASGGPRS